MTPAEADSAQQWANVSEENKRLRAVIIQTLNENGHLADGDVCTLASLKRAVPEWELPE